MFRTVLAAALLIGGTAVAHHHDAPIVLAHDHTSHGSPAVHHGSMHQGGRVATDGPAAAASLGPVAIEGAFARAAAVQGGASAAYMTLSIADGTDMLRSAASPAAARVELHTHTLDDQGVARMMEVPGIEVVAGSPTVLAQGGLHVMLMGLVAPLEPGDTLPLTLEFENAGTVTLDVPVRGMARRPATN